jgi:hypothetical protein
MEIKKMNECTVQVEFTLTQDGRLDFKSCNSDIEIIYELTRHAREQSLAYQRFQTRLDPLTLINLGIISLSTLLLCGVFARIVTRPVPEHLSIHRQL